MSASRPSDAVGGEGHILSTIPAEIPEKKIWLGPWSEVPLSGTSPDPDPRVVPRFD